MLFLITGAPGAGKTLCAVETICNMRAATPERVIYANIDGLNIPGVFGVSDDWIKEWHRNATKGAAIFVDEAQMFWRSTRGGGELPAAIAELELHRHDGIDIYMLTQHPTLIHANIRKLVTLHTHLVAHTKGSAKRWDWREAHDDVGDAALRTTGEFREWRYNVSLYPLYKSAETHTKTLKRPLAERRAKLAKMAAAVLFLGLLVAGGYDFYRHAMMASGKGDPLAKHAVQPGPLDALNASLTGSKAHLSVKEYVAQQIPRVPTQPWSAPLYDGAAPTTHPRIFCAETLKAPGVPKRCTCYTEQATRYTLNNKDCMQIAENGPSYDPYKQPDPAPASAGSVGQGKPVAATPVPADPLGVETLGGDRATAKAYTPPELVPHEAPSAYGQAFGGN